MPIYEITTTGISPVAETSFEAERVRERQDIQRLLKQHVDCLEEGLLVLTDEFGGWADSARRIDLLCLDLNANLVVIELKRTDDGGHMELQALRYAAMVSAMTFEQAAETFARHSNRAAPDIQAARTALLAHLGWDSAEEQAFAPDTRIVLAAADFGKELTTTVLWLRDREVDIRCVRLKPYRLEEGRILLDVQPIIPLPETAAFQTQIGEKQAVERRGRADRNSLQYQFWAALLPLAKQRTRLHENRNPRDGGWISGGIGRAGFAINYVARWTDSHVELWIADDKPAFHALEAQKEEIEAEFGAPLDWQELPSAKASRIRFVIDGGYGSPAEEWPRIHDAMIDAMIRLDRAFRRRVHAIRP